MRVVLLGCPRPVGGANVEAGHTALLWRKMGLDVRVVSTSLEPPGNPWPARLADAGCEVIFDREALAAQREALCVSFQNCAACRAWPKLAAQGCRLIWSPCMNFVLPHERETFRMCPPTGVHFQSMFQQLELGPTYTKWAAPMEVQFFRIPGAFEAGDFPYRPLRHNGAFVVGKLSRAWPDKFPKDLWSILGAARSRARVHLKAIVQGWNEAVEAKCGPPPPWATVYPEGTFTSPEFLGRCHALFCACQKDVENWSRCTLEAMASGVPVIADHAGGMLEMLRQGDGILVRNQEEAVEGLCRLARDEIFRLGTSEVARERVEQLADPAVLAEQWHGLFQTVRA